MDRTTSHELDEKRIETWAEKHIATVSKSLKTLSNKRTEAVMIGMSKVLDAFSKEQVGTHHFSSMTGYGHGDQGREVIDKVFAKVLGAEKAAVRLQFVSGTHAIAAALFGVLRPGETLLSITGKPYETLEEVIGIRGAKQGSLIEFGISYEELDLNPEGKVDFSALQKALALPLKMVFIQRSSGYTWRPSLSIQDIKEICDLVHKYQPKCICFVDNCYGEFVEEKEPTEVGADLIAGSLIKNLGGTIVPTGGYVAGKAELVESACCRLTSPGIGSKGGTSFDLNRLIFQGLFLAPQMISEALIGADLIAGVFHELGFSVKPGLGENRSDIIQSIQFGNAESVKVVCKAFQACSPIDSYLDPIPATMPGYESKLIMAGGTFIDGSTSEFSADAPLKPPYNLYIQGGTHHTHIKLVLKKALISLIKADLLKLPNNAL